jgi:hypothetical protein
MTVLSFWLSHCYFSDVEVVACLIECITTQPREEAQTVPNEAYVRWNMSCIFAVAIGILLGVVSLIMDA